jgi:drug/metabolite transporter (DMT)-like permease
LSALESALWRTIFGIAALLPMAWRSSGAGIFGAAVHDSLQTAAPNPIRITIQTKIRDRIPLWLIGVLGCGAMQWLFFLSAQRTYASHLTLIMALVPLTSRLYGVWFRRERLSARASVGMALGLAGSILILWPSASVGRSIWIGDLFAIGAMLCFTVYSEGFVRYAKAMPASAANFHMQLGGLVFLGFIALIAGWQGSLPILPSSTWLSLVYLGVCSTGLAYLFYSIAVQKFSSRKAAPFLFLQPVIGAGLAQAALGESITSRLAAGTLIVIAGLYLIHSSKE